MLRHKIPCFLSKAQRNSNLETALGMNVSLFLGNLCLFLLGLLFPMHPFLSQPRPLNPASYHVFPLLQTTLAGSQGKALGYLKLLVILSPQEGCQLCQLWSSHL